MLPCCFTSLMDVLGSIRIEKTSSTYAIILMILEWMQSGYFYATSHRKSPCDIIGGLVKWHVAKRNLQQPLNNQILNYEAMIDLCVEEIKDTPFKG